MEVLEASFMLTDIDSGVQRSFFRTFEFDRCGSRQVGPPLMESHWYDLVSRILEIIPADEMKGMGEKVRKANTSVRRHCIRATVFEKDSVGKRGRRRCSGCDGVGPAC